MPITGGLCLVIPFPQNLSQEDHTKSLKDTHHGTTTTRSHGPFGKFRWQKKEKKHAQLRKRNANCSCSHCIYLEGVHTAWGAAGAAMKVTKALSRSPKLPLYLQLMPSMHPDFIAFSFIYYPSITSTSERPRESTCLKPSFHEIHDNSDPCI